MAGVGLRDLRQNASELVRRVEAGEDVTITVAGRPSVRLVPIAPRVWRNVSDLAELFRGPGVPEWDSDRELVDQRVRLYTQNAADLVGVDYIIDVVAV